MHTAPTLRAALVGGFLAFVSRVRAQANSGDDFDWTSIQPSTKLSWVSCYTEPHQCTRLSVPLNYSNPSAGTVALALIRVPSTSPPTDYKGPVLYNPGGPGASGVGAVLSFRPFLQTYFGEQFDYVSFDPRGVGYSTPKIQIFNSTTEQAYYNLGPDLFSLEQDSTSQRTLPARVKKIKEFGKLAKERNEGVIEHVTTDNVARDLLSIASACGEEKVRYYGTSYGTVLGATFAAMFPDKVERMVLDGPLPLAHLSALSPISHLTPITGVSPLQGYYDVDWRNNVLDADKGLQVFFDTCSTAGPSKCPFSASKDGNATLSPRGIHKRLDQLLKRIALHPLPLGSPNATSTGGSGDGPRLTYPVLMNTIYGAIYEPTNYFLLIAQGLTAIDLHNDTSVLSPYIILGQDDGHGSAIFCTDGVRLNEGESGVVGLERYEIEARKVSQYFAAQGAGIPRAACSGWQIHPDNFRGLVEGNTSFPLLMIGNVVDPITPLAMAHKASTLFTGSQVLAYNTTGHTSLFLPSSCIRDHVRAYFGNGTLPGEGTVCQTDGVVDYYALPGGGAQAN